MKFSYVSIFSAVLMVAAQVRSVGIKPVGHAIADSTSANTLDGAEAPPAMEKRITTAGAPVIGYVLGPGPAELHAILTAKTSQVDDLVPVPSKCKRLYLPPRQRYAIVERNSDDPVAVWAMHKAEISGIQQAPIPLNGAMPHPETVVFSPRGDALILYSQATGSLQVVNGLPAQPAVTKRPSISNFGNPNQFALSDDGALVVARLADGSLVSSWNGAAWQDLPAGCMPHALLFIPNTHDLAISDTTQRMIMLLPSVHDTSRASYVLAQNMQADDLAVTKGGEQLVAANVSTGQVWIIDLNTGLVTAKDGAASINTISSLRDGFTFLLSTSHGLSMLKLGAIQELHDPANHAGTGLTQSTGNH